MTQKNIFSSIGDRTSLGQKVASKIEKAILSKELSLGDKLPSEHELCEQFEVSRTSVREAIRILSTQGIVQVEKGKGAFVKNLSSQSVIDGILKFYQQRLSGEYPLDLTRARKAIEPNIAYYAALNRTEKDLQKLEEHFRLEKENEEDLCLTFKYDMAFHIDLAYASKNKAFILMLKPLIQFKLEVEMKVGDAPDNADLCHQQLLDAIIDRDAESAKKSMIEHLNNAEVEHSILISSKKANTKINI